MTVQELIAFVVGFLLLFKAANESPLIKIREGGI